MPYLLCSVSQHVLALFILSSGRSPPRMQVCSVPVLVQVGWQCAGVPRAVLCFHRVGFGLCERWSLPRSPKLSWRRYQTCCSPSSHMLLVICALAL